MALTSGFFVCALLAIELAGVLYLAHWIAYLSWPIWATIVGLGALVGLM